MFDFKKKEQKVIDQPKTVEPPKQMDETTRMRFEVLEMKNENLTRKMIEQELIIRRLLDLVIMDCEHKDFSKHIMPQIDRVKNLLDKK